jgi:hypothetical protein
VAQQSTLPRAPIIITIIIINVNGKYIHTQVNTEPTKNGKILETLVTVTTPVANQGGAIQK